MLTELDIAPFYRSSTHDLLTDFYVPCLEHSVHYDRAVGYFTGHSLALAARGVTRLAARRGRMRVVASPHLHETDVQAIAAGYRSRHDVVEQRITEQLEVEQFDETTRRRIELLAWLVAEELLDIKLALVEPRGGPGGVGLYHEKVGIFTDKRDNRVVFTGSANETVGGLAANFESIEVFRSWNETDRPRLEPKIADFEKLWDNQTPFVDILDFPEAARKRLIRLAPPQPPQRDPAEPADATTVQVRPRNYRDLLHVTLWDHQTDAVQKWLDAGRRGILAMATGAGKTITAFGCIAHSRPLNFILVAVPTRELIEQWCEELAEHTELPDPIRIEGSAHTWQDRLFRKLRLLGVDDLPTDRRPVIAVGTYSELSKDRFLDLFDDAGGLPSRSMLIADEVHGAGAPKHRRTLRDDFDFRLGLSATPIRPYDEVGSQLLLEYFDGIAAEFTLEQGIDTGILCEYEYHVELAELTPEEYNEFRNLSAKMARAAAASDDEDTPQRADHWKMLAIRRANVLKRSVNKIEVISNLADHVDLSRGLIYCADIDQATEVAGRLSRQGINCARYSSADEQRRKILGQFARGEIDVLVAIKCLDEGVDVPASETAVMIASDASERQFVQRRGRVLRQAEVKDYARVYDVVVVPPEDADSYDVIKKELRRVRKFAETARNRHTLVADLADRLEPFGISPADLM